MEQQYLHLLVGESVELGVLGPVRVVVDGVEARVPRGRQRLLLARLLLDAGRVVPVDRLLDDVWRRSDGGAGTGAVRTAVWELRRQLGVGRGAGLDAATDEILVARDGGYVLAVARAQVDCVRFEAHLGEARSLHGDDPQGAVAELDRALGLWRGPAFGDLAGELVLHVEAARLDQMVLDARELRAGLVLELGRHDQLVSELWALARANPERERLWALLMTALYRSGRQSEALSCYQEARRSLVTAIGVEPGPELRRLEAAVLQHDPALDWRPPASLSTNRRHGPAANPVDPSPPAGDAHRHNLPRPSTGFVGRDEERQAVAAALGRSRLVTLVGVGGCGKTRLAIAVAEDVLPRFPGGVWFVDLSVLSKPELVPTVVADRDAGAGALLVLDNCEHLVEAVAELVARELRHRPDLRVLATSREELGLDGELVRRTGGLSLSRGDHDRPSGDSEAVELFLTRAAVALDGFAPGDEAQALVARICHRLDGLPLAIELAAAHVASLPISVMARRLEADFDLWSGQREGLPRHRTLRAALGWSVDLLDEPTRLLFTKLGVFAGGFTYAAAEQVVGPELSVVELTDGLRRLVRASLLDCVAGHDGVERYRMLHVVRGHACDRLEALTDVGDIRRRHAHHFAASAAAVDRQLRGPGVLRALEQLEVELPDLRAALRWAVVHDQLEVALRLLVSLRWFLPRLAPLEELDGWLAARVAHDADVAPDLRPGLLATSSMVAFLSGRHDRLRHLSARAVEGARQHDDRRHLAVGLATSAAAAVVAGELSDAEAYLGEARGLCDALGDRWGLAWTSVGHGMIAHATGGVADGRQEIQAALDVFRFLRDRHSQVVPMALLALHALAAEEVDVAHGLASEAVELVTTLDHSVAHYLVLGTLALVELAAGRRDAARDLFVRSLRAAGTGTTEGIILPANLEGLAMLAAATTRRYGDAVVLVSAAAQVRRSASGTPSPQWVAAIDVVLDEARQALGPARLEEQLALGRNLPLDELIRVAELATHPAASREGRPEGC